MKVTLKEKIDGYSLEAEYRIPKKGEHYLDGNNEVTIAAINHSYFFIVLTPERWRAKDGGNYWFVTDIFRVLGDTEADHKRDKILYESGNYFQTQEQAQKFADYCKQYFNN